MYPFQWISNLQENIDTTFMWVPFISLIPHVSIKLPLVCVQLLGGLIVALIMSFSVFCDCQNKLFEDAFINGIIEGLYELGAFILNAIMLGFGYFAVRYKQQADPQLV